MELLNFGNLDLIFKVTRVLLHEKMCLHSIYMYEGSREHRPHLGGLNEVGEGASLKLVRGHMFSSSS